jgi:biotin-(acetyl-CoA carboxylase) ligase
VLEEYDALPAESAPRYRERLDTLGRRVRVELPDGELDGRAIDVDPDGRLVVLDECGSPIGSTWVTSCTSAGADPDAGWPPVPLG